MNSLQPRASLQVSFSLCSIFWIKSKIICVNRSVQLQDDRKQDTIVFYFCISCKFTEKNCTVLLWEEGPIGSKLLIYHAEKGDDTWICSQSDLMTRLQNSEISAYLLLKYTKQMICLCEAPQVII